MWTELESQLGTYRDIFDTMLKYPGYADGVHRD